MFAFRLARLIPLLAVVTLAVCLLGVAAVPAQAAGFVLQVDPDPPAPVDLGALVAAVIAPFAATVAGLLEFLKRAFIAPVAEQQKWDDNRYRVVVNSLAFMISLMVAMVAGPKADVLRVVGINGLPSILGVLLGGVLIYLGNDLTHNGVNGVQSFVALLRAKIDAYASAVPVAGLLAEATPLAPVKLPGGWKTYIGDEDFEAFVDRLAETKAARASPTASVPSPATAPA